MSKFVGSLLSVLCLFGICSSTFAASDMRRASSKEEIEKIYQENLKTAKLAKQQKQLAFIKMFSEKYLTINVANMSYMAFKADFYAMADAAKLDKKAKENYFAQTIYFANVPKYGKFLTSLLKDSDFYHADSFIFNVIVKRHGSQVIENMPLVTFRQIAVELGKSKDIKKVKSGIALIKMAMDKMQDAEIKSDLKQIKRAIYPRIAVSDDWKAVAVEVELLLKSVE